jgi:hypothetical protein
MQSLKVMYESSSPGLHTGLHPILVNAVDVVKAMETCKARNKIGNNIKFLLFIEFLL